MIALLAPAIAGTLKTLVLSALSEKLLIEVTFLLLRTLTNSTKNELDNKILKQFEAVYRSK
jgi:ATP-dependent exoDNAse (exonuclease V) beta subunit